MKKLLSVLLALTIILSTFSILSISSSASNSPKSYIVKTEYDESGVLHEYLLDENGNILPWDAFNNSEDDLLCTASVNELLPKSYSSVTEGKVSSVKNQGSFGTCWAHAFIAAAESSLISQGYTDTSVDLSEAHLVWFRRHNYVEGSSNPVQRDYYSRIEDTFKNGGNETQAIATITRKSGFATEEKYKYDKLISSFMEFDQSKMFDSDYELTSAGFFTISEKEKIKKSIMTYGALSTGMYYSKTYLNSATGSYYQNVEEGRNSNNHAIAVVGWDDNYPADNFTIKPSKNGAWLCKNSYGAYWGNNGYFWISYEDKSVEEFWEVVARPAHDDYIYQYDGIYHSRYVLMFGNATTANIFTANGTETIRECGFHLGNSANVTCTATLYTNLTSSNNPTKGTAITSGEIQCTQKGFYRIPLPNDYVLSPNEKFSIVLNVKGASGTQIAVPFEDGRSTYATYYSEPGQSFYSFTGGTYWSDVANDPSLGNIPIKAYAEEVEAKPISIEINTLPDKTAFVVNDRFDYTGLSLNLVYDDGTKELIKDGFTAFADTSIIGPQDVTVTYDAFTTSYPINVMENVPTSISVASQTKNYYFVNSTYEPENLTLNVTFLNGEVQKVTDGFTYEDVVFSSLGDYEVNIYYAGLTTKTIVHVIPIQTLKTKEGSTTFVNYDTKIVSGLQSGLTDLDDYIVVDEGYSYIILDSVTKYIGSGTTVMVFAEDELIDMYSVVIFGDVTGDSFCDGQDAMIIKCIADNINVPMSMEFMKAADCNHDGFVTAEDAAVVESAGLYLADIIQAELFFESTVSEELLVQDNVQCVQEEQPYEIQNTNWLISLILRILDLLKSVLNF